MRTMSAATAGIAESKRIGSEICAGRLAWLVAALLVLASPVAAGLPASVLAELADPGGENSGLDSCLATS